MKADKLIAAHVTPSVHQRIEALALKRGASVSVLIQEALEEMFDEAVGELGPSSEWSVEPGTNRTNRVAIRLRPGDAQALVRRAGVRRMKPSTYIAALVRAHIVEDPPLPSAELALLERTTAELSAVGRNLNQITRAVNGGAAVPAGTAALIGRSIELVEAVRAATKDYVRAAVASWEAPLG